MKVFDERGFVESQSDLIHDWQRDFGESISIRVFEASTGCFAVQLSNDDCVDYGDPNVCTLTEVAESKLGVLLDLLIGVASIAAENRLSWREK